MGFAALLVIITINIIVILDFTNFQLFVLHLFHMMKIGSVVASVFFVFIEHLRCETKWSINVPELYKVHRCSTPFFSVVGSIAKQLASDLCGL